MPLIGRMVGIILVFVLRRQNCAITKHYINKFETVPFKPHTGYCGFGEKDWCTWWIKPDVKNLRWQVPLHA